MAIGVERELDVLRGAKSVLDPTPHRGKLQHLGVAEDGCATLDDALVDRAGLRVGRVVVGIDRARHDGFAQPCGRVDDRSTPSTGDRIRGEQDPGRLRVDHALHDHGQANALVVDPMVAAIGDGAFVPQRRPASADRVEELLFVLDAKVRVLLAGEGSTRQVLRGGR